jgi:hypothetical protein
MIIISGDGRCTKAIGTTKIMTTGMGAITKARIAGNTIAESTIADAVTMSTTGSRNAREDERGATLHPSFSHNTRKG